MREWEIGAVENIHGALPYIRFAPILALVSVGVNRIGKTYPFSLLILMICLLDSNAIPFGFSRVEWRPLI